MDFTFMSEQWLTLVFASLMGLAVLLYVILDGYDLGVGILLNQANDQEKDTMIASIGPFWDANETWLVLGIGILLVAFPIAHGEILTNLYLPTAIMLIMLILRGVSFDFRAKVIITHKHIWNKLFSIGSIGASLAQGYMLGLYIMGFDDNLSSQLFAMLVAVCLASGYSFMGGAWLIMRTEGILQVKAVRWTRISLWLTTIGIALVSITTPIISSRIFDKWFSMPNIILLAPIPIITGSIILAMEFLLRKLPLSNDRLSWVPFIGAMSIFALSFQGLAYSFYPYIIPEKMTIYEASTSPEALKVMLIGVLIVLPCIIAYTIFVYRLFWGKVQELKYY